MTGLTSADLPPRRPDDHVCGEGREAIVYLDLECPHCAAAWGRLRRAPLCLVFRHFPVASKHPRAAALHAAAEAAAVQRQGAFWELVDSIYADQAHIDDPHLWERARALGLDLERFERDRRSEGAAMRVQRDFDDGIRAGVTGTPAAFLEGRRVAGDIVQTPPL
jgi:protein-disulfide isomerase